MGKNPPCLLLGIVLIEIEELINNSILRFIRTLPTLLLLVWFYTVLSATFNAAVLVRSPVELTCLNK